MANNEIKVTIKADNKPFLESLKLCTAELKKFQQATDSMKIDTNNLAKAEAAMKSLSDAMKAIKGGQTVTVGADVSQALSAIHEVESAAKSAQEAKVNVSVDKAQAISDIENIQQTLTKISSSLSNISVDNGQALRAAEETQKAIDGIHDEKVNVELKNTDALAALKQLSEALKGLKSIKITVEADGKDAEAEMKKVAEAVQNVRKNLKAITVKINTRTALQNITNLISAARRLRQELKDVKLPAGGNNELAAQLQRIAALNRQILSTMKDISAESRKISASGGGAGKSSESMLSKLGNLSLVASGAVQAFTMIKDLAGSIVMPGFNFTKEMEMNQLGIAGILQSMTLLNGQAVSFGDAMSISSDMMKKLQKDAIMTSATTEELVTTFRALLAPGIGAGMNLDEIQKLTTTGVNAVKSIGLDSTQFVQELRDLVQGGIQASSSTLATSLGLTDKDIQEAKASSEGLFKFLMDRLAGFSEVQFHFPDTLEGQMSRLKEVSTLASAEITEAFEEDFKELVGFVADLIGDVNEKTGEFTVNPAIKEAIEELSDGIETLKNYFVDLKECGALDWVDDAIPVVKSLYNIIKDLCGIIGDMGLIFDAAMGPIRSFIWGGIRKAANEIEWLIGEIRTLISEMTVSIGVRKEHLSPEKIKEYRELQDITDEQAELYKTRYVGDTLTSKFDTKAQQEAAKAAEKAEKERIKLAQKALKEMVAYWKVELDRVIRSIDNRREENQAKYDQNYIGADQYYLTKVRLDIETTEANLEKLQKELEATKNLPIDPKNESDKKTSLDKITGEIEKYTDELAKQKRALEDITNGINKAAQERPPVVGQSVGTAPVSVARRLISETDETGNPLHMYGDTRDNPNNFVCTQLVVKSWDGIGLEDALHAAGIETTDKDGNEMRNWVPAMIEVANKLGAWVDGNSGYEPKAGDAIVVNGDNHVVMATGEKNGYVASSSTGRPIAEYGDYNAAFEGAITGFISLEKMAEAAKLNVSVEHGAKRMLKDPGLMIDKDSAAWKTAHKNEMGKALEIMQNFYEGLGNVSSVQIARLEIETEETIRLLEAQKLPSVAEMARQVLERQKKQFKFTQMQKDLEYAQDDLVDTQEELYYELESGTKTSTQITEEYLARCKELFGGKLTELQAQLAEAIRTGDRDMARDIKNKIKEVITTIGDGIKAILDKIDAEANREIEKIQMNKHLTNMQKDDAIDAVRQGANEKKAKTLQKDIDEWKASQFAVNQDKQKSKDFQDKHGGFTIDQAILSAEKELEYLNYQLEQTPTLLDKVQIAGKQAFEDGLLDFLTRGINECENLGDAVQDLARTVLEAIQRMYAEALVKNIMGALFPAAGASIPGSGNSRPNGILGPLRPDGSFASGGAVRGPGTGTSDSILAALSDGEFVINANAVKQIGTDTLHRINSGQAFQLPLPKFAEGGMISDNGKMKSISGFAAYELGERMDSFGASISNSFTPEVVVRNTFNGDGLAKSMESFMVSVADDRYKKNMVEYAKMQSMLVKKFG